MKNLGILNVSTILSISSFYPDLLKLRDNVNRIIILMQFYKKNFRSQKYSFDLHLYKINGDILWKRNMSLLVLTQVVQNS